MRRTQQTQARFVIAAALAAALTIGAVAAGGYAVSAHVDATPASTITVARFFGGVSSSGSALASGSTVTASVDGVACGVGTVSGGQYTVDVQELPGCINPGKKVDFIVNGRPASPQGSIPSLQGAAVQVNLSVAQATPTPSPSPAPTAAAAVTAAPTSAAVAAAAATSAPTRTSAAPPSPPALPSVTSAARTPTPRPATPAGTATRSAAAASPKPAVAPASAQRPATKAAAPALPKTGTGGAARDGRTATLIGLVLAAAAILAGAGAVALRRRP
jgi:hypothetical protein